MNENDAVPIAKWWEEKNFEDLYTVLIDNDSIKDNEKSEIMYFFLNQLNIHEYTKSQLSNIIIYIMDNIKKCYNNCLYDIILNIITIHNLENRYHAVRVYYSELIDRNLFSDKVLEKFCYISIEYDNLIPDDVFEMIHDEFGIVFFKKNLRRFNIMLQYCRAFKYNLSDYEKETFAKRLQIKSRYKYIDWALNNIDFNEKQKRKLITYETLYKISI